MMPIAQHELLMALVGGWFQYFLVTMMTCSTLAAIMSTADSAVMGASSIVSAAWSSEKVILDTTKKLGDPMKSGCCFHPPYGVSICRALGTRTHSLFSEPRFYLDVGESGYNKL